MKPSEYLAEWYQSAADGYKDGVPDDEVVVFNRILALLEAVEEAKTWKRPSMAGYEDFEAPSEERIIRAALTLKGVK